MANMLTHLSRGDTALSVTMTAISSVGAVDHGAALPRPLDRATSAPPTSATPACSGWSRGCFAITIVPVAIGMELRRAAPGAGRRRSTRGCGASPSASSPLVVLGAIASEHDTVAENIAEVAGAALALNVAAMTLSFTIAKLARLDDRQSTAIALELGIHNAALAIAVGASLAPR